MKKVVVRPGQFFAGVQITHLLQNRGSSPCFNYKINIVNIAITNCLLSRTINRGSSPCFDDTVNILKKHLLRLCLTLTSKCLLHEPIHIIGEENVTNSKVLNSQAKENQPLKSKILNFSYKNINKMYK
jgi:hypothetical protein